MKANRTLLNACAFVALATAAQAAGIPKTWVETQAGSPTGQYLVIDLTLRQIAVGPQTDPDMPPKTRQGFAVSNLAAVPPGGWTDEYRTNKLVLRRIPAGTFTMGSPANELGRDADEAAHPVTLTKDYYVGIFDVTQKQWQQVMGDWARGGGGSRGQPVRPPPPFLRDVLPVEQVSYYQIREKFGKPEVVPVKDAEVKNKAVAAPMLVDDDSSEDVSAPGAAKPPAASKPPEPLPEPLDDPAVDWPANSVINADSFMGRLRAKTGLTALDLPTEAQWEYACRAGTTTALHSGKDLTDTMNCPNVAEVARYRNNAGKPEGWNVWSTNGYSYGWQPGFQGYSNERKWMGKAPVGSYPPNRWGLYDMHGNVWEWCLDWYAETYPGAVTDPKGPATGERRVLRGGSSDDPAACCRAANRGAGGYPVYRNADFGFRVVMTIP
jgi:formylglycine-generating enzyme required for sulfatase activity